ncbi:MAG: hypothetical protein A3I02_06755 [Betaproteobacteria bacterium RIFCSPLOWO2_02_FULL_67_26]|nr:MAG: hypothetical protein A3I02_06755 [Betaproteobacteria bacterium RIFCSPLOWO2_02_FULL_67_26]
MGLALAMPAQAGDRPDPFAQLDSLLNPKVLLQGVVREEDVALLFAHLRAALLAASEEREAPLPDELNRRAEAIGAELRMRGTLTGLLFLTAFEAAARQAVLEALAEPAPAAR